MTDTRLALNECLKARQFIKHGLHVADARLVLRRAQRRLVAIRDCREWGFA